MASFCAHAVVYADLHTLIFVEFFSAESLSVELQDLLKLSQSISQQHLANHVASIQVKIQEILQSWGTCHDKKALAQGVDSPVPLRLLSSPPGSSSDTASSDSGEHTFSLGQATEFRFPMCGIVCVAV